MRGRKAEWNKVGLEVKFSNKGEEVFLTTSTKTLFEVVLHPDRLPKTQANPKHDCGGRRLCFLCRSFTVIDLNKYVLTCLDIMHY